MAVVKAEATEVVMEVVKEVVTVEDSEVVKAAVKEVAKEVVKVVVMVED